MSLGSTIQSRREALGLTQEELAERLNVSRQAVSKWETDAAAPTAANLQELSGILQLELSSSPPGTAGKTSARRAIRLREVLCALGWVLALALGVLLWQQRAAPAKNDAGDQITEVSFYDSNGKQIQQKDNWYALDPETTAVVAFQCAGAESVTAELTPTGTETADQRRQVAVAAVPDGQSYALLHLSLPKDTLGQIQIVLDTGKERVISDLYCVVCSPEP